MINAYIGKLRETDTGRNQVITHKHSGIIPRIREVVKNDMYA